MKIIIFLSELSWNLACLSDQEARIKINAWANMFRSAGERWVSKTAFTAKEDVLMKYPVKSDTVPDSWGTETVR